MLVTRVLQGDTAALFDASVIERQMAVGFGACIEPYPNIVAVAE